MNAVPETHTGNEVLAPGAEVQRMDDDTFSVLLERVKIDECWDQSREVQMGQGCIGSPGRPGC